MFDLQPTLSGKLLSLRPLRETDFPALFSAASDPEIWAQHPARDRYTEPVFRKFFDGGIESGGAFIIHDLASGSVIGSSRFCFYSQERDEIEIGFTFLSRQFWGGAYNSELKSLMLNHAFNYVGSVIFCVGSGNFRSQRAVQKLGAEVDKSSIHCEPGRIIYRLSKAHYLARPVKYAAS